jgi:uncharacterized protein YoxC
MSIEKKMQRLEEARRKAEEVSRKKERLNGQIEVKRKQLEKLEKKAQDEFDCTIDKIPDMVESLDKEATEALEKAERLLGLSKENVLA